jgi:MFS family permease
MKKKILPVLLVGFTNRIASIGLSLVPILLVQKNFSTHDSALVMSVIKFSAVIMMLIGGYLSDVFSAWFLCVVSFFCMGLGMMGLPFVETASWMIVCGVISQFGDSLNKLSLRWIVQKSVEPKDRQVSIGWLRMINNAAQVIAYCFGLLVNQLGVVTLMLMDAITSILAGTLSLKILPRTSHAILRHDRDEKKSELTSQGSRFHWKSFDPHVLKNVILFSFIMFSWNFMYELIMTGLAARIEKIHAGNGIRIFSLIMMINTVLCALFAVKASHFFKRAEVVLPIGILGTVLGFWVSVQWIDSLVCLLLGSFLYTLAEVALGNPSYVLKLIKVVSKPCRYKKCVTQTIEVLNTFGSKWCGLM